MMVQWWEETSLRNKKQTKEVKDAGIRTVEEIP